jgi:hypothetical protein
MGDSPLLQGESLALNPIVVGDRRWIHRPAITLPASGVSSLFRRLKPIFKAGEWLAANAGRSRTLAPIFLLTGVPTRVESELGLRFASCDH